MAVYISAGPHFDVSKANLSLYKRYGVVIQHKPFITCPTLRDQVSGLWTAELQFESGYHTPHLLFLLLLWILEYCFEPQGNGICIRGADYWFIGEDLTASLSGLSDNMLWFSTAVHGLLGSSGSRITGVDSGGQFESGCRASCMFFLPLLHSTRICCEVWGNSIGTCLTQS